MVKLLDAYGREYHIPSLDKSVDFGYLYFITKPIFFCLDWLNSLTGNFGLAIIIFTVGVKLLFFPLASYSYRSMGRMKLVQPKIQAIRERLKEEPAKQQQEIMALYKAEKINPASGCLPMLVQIPVFFSLYKVIFTTIEMRQAPFYGWIHDLSVPDPTNLFNLFGLIPFDPTIHQPAAACWRAADHHGHHDVSAAEAESGAAGPGAGAHVPVHADHLHFRAGALAGWPGAVLGLEQPSLGRTTMADHAPGGEPDRGRLWRRPRAEFRG